MNLNGYDVIVRDGSVFVDDELIGYVWKNRRADWTQVCDVPPPSGWAYRRNDRYSDATYAALKTRREALVELVELWQFWKAEAEREAFDRYLEGLSVEHMTDEALEAEREVAELQRGAVVEGWKIAVKREGATSKAAAELALSGDKCLARAAFYAFEQIRREAQVDRPLWQLMSEAVRLRVMDRLQRGPLDERTKLDLANFASSREFDTSDREGFLYRLQLGTVDCFGERSVYTPGGERLGFVRGWAPFVP